MNIETIKMMLSGFTDEELAAAFLDRILDDDISIKVQNVDRLIWVLRKQLG